VDAPNVDYRPTCGNILVGVGPAAIEMGIVPARDPETRVRIWAVNTGALVEALVQTPGGRVRYEGETAIDGVAGTAAPVGLNFIGVVGSKTGAMFDGDGSLLMHIQEFETIRRHGLNVLIVLMNDGAYGSQIHKLRADGLDDGGAVFGRADLAAIARGCGVAGETVDDLSRLPAMVEAFRRTGGAAVWDIPVSDRDHSPVIRRAHPGIERAAVPSR